MAEAHKHWPGHGHARQCIQNELQQKREILEYFCNAPSMPLISSNFRNQTVLSEMAIYQNNACGWPVSLLVNEFPWHL
jgi:hypothetical protein